MIAASSENIVYADFMRVEQDYDFRKLKNLRSRLQRAANKAGYEGTIFFEADRAQKKITISSLDKSAFFKLIDKAKEVGMFETLSQETQTPRSLSL